MQLRRRLVCHYCGQKSSKSKHHNGRFQCEHCDAVNHLDENGEIADVPPEELDGTPTQTRFTDSIWCSTCLQNQYMYKTRLDDILPDPDHPQYAGIEARLPQQLKELEKRFPQCCAQCEPKARARLQESAYEAKSDHMRWMLDKSRQRKKKSLVVSAAGLGYVVGLILELFAHGLESQGYRFHPPLVGLLFVWWNPKWQEKLQGRRLVGLGRYYMLQVVLVAIRVGAWWEVGSPVREMSHTLALISILVLTGYAMFVVKVVTPQVDWNFEVPKLVTEGQYVPPPVIRPVLPDLEPWRPPTPPVEEDAMDWTPSQNFEKPKLIRYKDPSPFYGRLPGVQSEVKEAIGLPIGHFDERKKLPMKEQSKLVMAEPKFFPKSIDTGLEGIFDSVFSLGDEKKNNVPENEAGTKSTPQTRQGLQYSQLPLFQSALLLIALPLWIVADRLVFPNLRLYILAFVVCVVGAGGLLGSMEGIVIASMGYYVWAGHEWCRMVGTVVLGLLLAQEVVMYIGQRAVPVEPTGLTRKVSVEPPGLSRKASVESMFSMASVDTTSTASAWKTPKKVERGGFGMSGLSLGDGFGNSVTPRRR